MQYRERNNKLSKLLADSGNRKDICIQLLLTWLMSADGNVTENEINFLDDASPPGKDEAYLEEFLFMCDDGKYLEIQLACEFLRQTFSSSDRREFIRLAIGMILADGRFTYMERYILELYADLFDIPRSELASIFKELKGKDLPVLGDPSSKQWWICHDQEQDEKRRRQAYTTPQANSEYGYSSQAPSASERREILRSRACAILGVRNGASHDDIRMAYRRLAQIHHPDRFQRLGDEAVQVASETFNRIKKAQDFLLHG